MSSVSQKSFALGELTPSLYARSDLQRYTTALRTCRNNQVMRQGGLQNRPGTVFISEVKDSSKTVRLVEWIFNADNAYVLEFGNEYIRFYRDGEQLESSPGVPLEVVTTYQEADLPDLNFAQSADVMTIVHKSYAPRELSRLSDTSWTLSAITYGPSIDVPGNFAAGGSTAGFAKNSWWITAVNAAGEESLADLETSNTRATVGTPIELEWDAVTDAIEYRLYKKINPYSAVGVFDSGLDSSDLVTGLLFTQIDNGASSYSYTDDGTVAPDPNFLPTNTIARNPFDSANNYPGAVLYSQQRRIFASSTNNPERVWASYIGAYSNFEIYQEIIDACQVQFDLAGRQINEIKHLLETRKLLALTIGSEWAINGNDAGGLTPTTINAKQQTFYGSSPVRPLNIGDEVYFIQARGTRARALGFDFASDGYRSPDLTIYSSHLFDNNTIVDWAYQQNPNSIVWAVRSDGVLLGFTTVKEQEMLSWHRHDFDGGTVENVCVVPADSEDDVYVVVKRTINGTTARYIEKFNTRQIDDVRDAIFMDSTLSYDGRNTTSTTMTISGGTTWTHLETLTLTASASFFVAGDVGNQIFVYDDDVNSASYGDVIRFSIEGYSGPTVVTGRSHKTVPAAMRSTSTLVWSKAVDEISGLDHLEGEQVSVFADGFVIASPNNAAYTAITVASGAITLPQPRAVIHVGLPYISDVETLDIDTQNGESLSDKNKLITKVSMFVEKSRGMWIGPRPPSDDDTDPLEDLREPKLRNNESYDEPTELKTEVISVQIPGEWNSNGRVFVRQVDPLPLSILSIVPSGYVPRAG